jgi:hypothetical protein
VSARRGTYRIDGYALRASSPLAVGTMAALLFGALTITTASKHALTAGTVDVPAGGWQLAAVDSPAVKLGFQHELDLSAVGPHAATTQTPLKADHDQWQIRPRSKWERPVTRALGTAGNVSSAWANVRDFGAVGVGVHDDTAGIQAALDASQTVTVPPGTYRLTATLVGPATGDRAIFSRGPCFLIRKIAVKYTGRMKMTYYRPWLYKVGRSLQVIVGVTRRGPCCHSPSPLSHLYVDNSYRDRK